VLQRGLVGLGEGGIECGQRLAFFHMVARLDEQLHDAGRGERLHHNEWSAGSDLALGDDDAIQRAED
jgi:hypothetical protein